MFYFHDIQFLYLLLLLIPLLFFIKNTKSKLDTIFSKRVLEKIEIKNSYISAKTRQLLLLISIMFAIVALARPYLLKGEIKVKSSYINIVTAIDMSRSMFANDIYPNRFEFAKKKFYKSLNFLKSAKVALIGFSSQTFLISPLTEDFHSLKFLAKNLNLSYLSLKGTDILTALKTTNDLFGKEKKKILFLLTDGGDNTKFDDEIDYAKKHDIHVFVYNIGTKKGGIIKDNRGVLKDKNGDIVVVKINENIKELALKTGGAYLKYSLKSDDIKKLADAMLNTFKKKDTQNSTIKDKKEIFYYPLIVSIILFFISIFSLPRGKKW